VTLQEGLVGELGRRMLEEPNWVARAKAAERLCALFCGGTLGASEGGLAEEFFRLACFDGEVLVRRVLAESLKRSEQLSRKTVLLFTADRPDVAAPLIEHSPILCEDDLLRILHDESHAHRLAVARRFELHEPVSEPMLATGNLELITAVLSNPRAAIRENTLLRLAARAPLRPQIAVALARRRALLPPRIAAVLFEMFGGCAFPQRRLRPPRPRERPGKENPLPGGPFWQAPGELAFSALAGPIEPRPHWRGGR
jgi:uncharacterized protein (DUF2336 family)